YHYFPPASLSPSLQPPTLFSPSTRQQSIMSEMAEPPAKKICPSDERKQNLPLQHPPTRRGIIVNVMVESADKFVDFMGKAAKAKEYFRFPDE
ncbi:unnamed protein product, partial [Ectocarpus sp. 12 AP-2014]